MLSPLKLATRFHKTCNALATQEQLQSGITMASVIRIDSNFFVWLRVCLLYVGDNMPRAPRARGHVHVPFFEGTCQNLIWGTLATLEQLQSQITMVTELRIGSNFFVWLRVCLLYVGDNMPRARGHVHMPFYEGTCQNLFSATWGTLEIYIGGT